MNAYTVFAVAIMLVLGLWQVLAGLTAVVGGDGLYATPPGYTYSFSRRRVGLGGPAARGPHRRGWCRRSAGSRWGDTAAIVLACLSMIVNFLTRPLLPDLVVGDHRAGRDTHLGPDDPRPTRDITTRLTSAPALPMLDVPMEFEGADAAGCGV